MFTPLKLISNYHKHLDLDAEMPFSSGLSSLVPANERDRDFGMHSLTAATPPPPPPAPMPLTSSKSMQIMRSMGAGHSFDISDEGYRRSTSETQSRECLL